MDSYRILITDDDGMVRRIISRILTNEGMLTFEAESGIDAVKMLRNLSVDLIIMDLVMDGMDGIQAVREIRALGIDTPIFMLSGCQSDSEKILALGYGADDFISKPFSTDVLCAKVRAFLRRANRSANQSDGVITIGPFCYISDEMRLLKNGERIALSSKECLLMKYFMSSPNKVLSIEQIYNHVWGEQVVDDNTVMVHIRRLRMKIEDTPDDPTYIRTVRGVGYQFCTR